MINQLIEAHPPGGEGRHPPGRRPPPPTAHRGYPPSAEGVASVHGGQRPISPQVLTKDRRPPLLCRHCIVFVFLGLTNTCCNRNACSSRGTRCTGRDRRRCNPAPSRLLAPQRQRRRTLRKHFEILHMLKHIRAISS